MSNNVEQIKESSQHLRGTLPEEVTDSETQFGKDSQQLLKHHGIYQQDDRDLRGKGADKSARHYQLMVRVRIAGGRLSSVQMRDQLNICDQLGNGSLRITTRQAMQVHGVLKQDLRQTVARINLSQLTTLAACGDVVRNVMCTPLPIVSNPIYGQIQTLADQISVHFLPQTPAYHEVWLKQDVGDGAGNGDVNHEPIAEKIHSSKAVAGEPIYGDVYLPRKFKIGIGLPGDNSVDVYAQDVGLLAVCDGETLVGYNVLAGGGFGLTPSAKKTFVAIAQPLAFATPDQVIPLLTAIVLAQRDLGDRSDRKVARLKYTLHRLGLPKFQQEVEHRYGQPLVPPRPLSVQDFDDGMGWHPQGDGRFFYGLNIENGRIDDRPDRQLKTALRQICERIAPEIRLTPHQSLLFVGLDAAQRATLEAILDEHNVPRSETVSTVRRWSMACPALPTCGLAITESERVLPTVMDQFETMLAQLSLQHERFTIRMTGCPNGCARPYNSDIGLVGQAKGKYRLFLGGRTQGDRLSFEYESMVPTDEIVTVLQPLFERFKAERDGDESFGDFCWRAVPHSVTA